MTTTRSIAAGVSFDAHHGGRQSLRLCIYVLIFLIIFNWQSDAIYADPPETLDPHPGSALDTMIPRWIVIPKINLDSEIITVQSQIKVIQGQVYREWETADNLVGWHDRSARLGEIGNTVLTGHSNIYGRVFQNLSKLEPGDIITIKAQAKIYHYRATQFLLLKESGVSTAQRVENGRWISKTEDERLTLVTCAYPGATHRLVIVAYPILPDPFPRIFSRFRYKII